MEFGNKLKHLREQQGWSQDDLAQRLNVSRQAVYKWESNKGYPDIQNLIAISDLFEVTIDELIREDHDLQNKISIDEDEESFEQLSDPGFYLGLVIILLGLFVFDNSSGLLIIGMLVMVFFTDIIQSIRSFIKNLK
ncbi:helix-turn-helix domain-containing protein [Marinicrinis lubricantis]|uniref:Helix-turn-helix domain-containing protein n=1 Tax=Marinicrinis lubricantis TaxID=2086470 RepID=A0ABW1IKN3_9BACL